MTSDKLTKHAELTVSVAEKFRALYEDGSPVARILDTLITSARDALSTSKLTNNATKRTLEFELADAPMLAHALQIEATTAWMSRKHDVKNRLMMYHALIEKNVAKAALLFDGEDWAEIGMALRNAETFMVTIEKRSWEESFNTWYGGVLVVLIEERRWCADTFTPFLPGAPEVLTVHAALSEIAPMDCVGSYDDLLGIS